MKIISVVGARPNFIKIAPVIRAMEESNKRLRTSDMIFLSRGHQISVGDKVAGKVSKKSRQVLYLKADEVRITDFAEVVSVKEER